MVTVAIIGTGFMARTHAAAYSRIEDVRLAAISGRSSEKIALCAKEFSCRAVVDPGDLLEDDTIDIVDLCVPTFLHDSYIERAVHADKQVLCEKPLCLTEPAADRIVNLIEKKGTIFMVAQTIRFWPEYELIHQWVHDGRLGRLLDVQAERVSQKPDWGPWFEDTAKSGGAVFDLLVHDVDFLTYLAGMPLTVRAVGAGTTPENRLTCVLQYRSGLVACVHSCNTMTSGFPFQMSFRLSGDEGTIDFQFSTNENLENRTSAKRRLAWYRSGRAPELLQPEPGDAYENELRYFVGCVREHRRPTIVTPRESADVVHLLCRIRDSLRSDGAEVRVGI